MPKKPRKFYMPPGVCKWPVLMTPVGAQLARVDTSNTYGFIPCYTSLKAFRKEWPKEEPVILMVEPTNREE